MLNNLKSALKKFKLLWYIVQYLKLLTRLIKSYFKRLKIFLFYRRDARFLKEMRSEVRGMFPLNLDLKNIGGFPQYYHGKNILGYTGMSFLEKDGVNVGMSEGRIKSGNFSLPIVQLKTDMEVNYKNLFRKFKPTFVVDFGTNHGGSAVFFYELIKEYAEPHVLTIDITDKAYNEFAGFHKEYKTSEKIQAILNKSSLECVEEVRKFLSSRKPGERVLLSYDDDHTYEHTYKELISYGPLLQSGDVILMQDTWNQGLLDHTTSPMLAVYRFLKEYPQFEQDIAFNKQMELPCNFIYGVIVKK